MALKMGVNEKGETVAYFTEDHGTSDGEVWLTYDQITLIPTEISTLEHRAEATTKTQFGPVELDLPLIAAPMPDVSNGNMAKKLSILGSLGFIHRFQPIEEMVKEYEGASGLQYHLGLTTNMKVIQSGIAVGVTGDWYATVGAFYSQGARIFCVDTANGANLQSLRAVEKLRNDFDGIFIIAGNVGSLETFRALQGAGAHAIRVGIAGGSVCETKTETGVYTPMATAVANCVAVRDSSLVIADGGIRTPADFCKALALGADVVMAGGIFAGTSESPGAIIKDIDGVLKKQLRGAASFGVFKETNGVDPQYVEGAETLVEYKGSVDKVIKRFKGGLQSAMSYMDARTLAEFRQNVKVVGL